uniref:Uncharacterized protein n=1 Tax=Acetithermum autotrophicum TaxID=1446466 RepID=H5SU79_ACEAU|nr:hypothetical protein HGMM_OP4C715 [Candidatus Acetothermum autotrophicum]
MTPTVTDVRCEGVSGTGSAAVILGDSTRVFPPEETVSTGDSGLLIRRASIAQTGRGLNP